MRRFQAAGPGLKPFRNCSVDFATSGVAKTVLLGSCAERFAMKFLVMTLQPLPAETVRYWFSDFIQAINLRGADKQSLWALRQLSKVSSPDLVIVQPSGARGVERKLAAKAAQAPLAFGIQMPRVDCTICVVLRQTIWLFDAEKEAVASLGEALVNIQLDDRADGVVSNLLAKPDLLPCEGWLFFVLGYIHDIASMAVTIGLIHPDAHSGNVLYSTERATGDVRFSWCDFGASSLRYSNGTSDLPPRWRHQIFQTLRSGVHAAATQCGKLFPAEWRNLPDVVKGEYQGSHEHMLAALATDFQVSLLRDSPSMAPILSRVSQLSGPLLMEISRQRSELESQRSELESQLKSQRSELESQLKSQRSELESQLESQLKSQRSELESQLKSQRSELESKISSLESQLQKMMFHLNSTESHTKQ